MVRASIRMPAKINLALRVLRKREDGYHDIWSVMVPISVFDEIDLTLENNTRGVFVQCNAGGVPGDESNLVVRALRAYQSVAGWPDVNVGIRIKLEKEIPVGAGLGGGSADAAGMLILLNRLNPGPLESEKLESIGASVGADVPFFLKGCPCIAEGIGDRLKPVSNLKAYSLVLVKPPFSVSTAWAYRSLELTETVDFFIKRKDNGEVLDAVDLMANDLELVTIARYPVLAEIKEWLKAGGAKGTLMSGSGPTVFGLFEDAEAAVRVAEEAMRVWGKDYWIRAASIISDMHKS